MDATGFHPQFAAWLALTPASVQADLALFFAGTASDPNFAHAHPTGLYARQRALLDYAQARYGYQSL